ncbi:phage tail fiber assembly protein [Edwardsiella tarda]|uniref:tail fiber assembly protein n=1 Tax=Edwardsiella tarda TaxID=636 RepID=UPI0034DCF6AE
MEFLEARIYQPDEKKFGDDAIYFRNSSGDDWYDSYGKFTKKYKLCVEPQTRVVRSVSEDAGRLYPAGFTVVEVDTLPDNFSIDGSWQYIDGEVVKRIPTNEELVAISEKKKLQLLAKAADAIAPLQDAVDLSDATPDEEARLKAWKRFRVEVNRVDTSAAPNISWPAQPE